VRDFVSGGGTGNLNPNIQIACPGVGPVAPGCGGITSSVQQFFGPIPVQNNLVLTLGLIFKLL
jgi:hypothetical protein